MKFLSITTNRLCNDSYKCIDTNVQVSKCAAGELLSRVLADKVQEEKSNSSGLSAWLSKLCVTIVA